MAGRAVGSSSRLALCAARSRSPAQTSADCPKRHRSLVRARTRGAKSQPEWTRQSRGYKNCASESLAPWPIGTFAKLARQKWVERRRLALGEPRIRGCLVPERAERLDDNLVRGAASDQTEASARVIGFHPARAPRRFPSHLDSSQSRVAGRSNSRVSQDPRGFARIPAVRSVDRAIAPA